MSENNKNWKEYEIQDVMSFENITSAYNQNVKSSTPGKENSKQARQLKQTVRRNSNKRHNASDFNAIFTILSSSAVIMCVLLLFVFLKTKANNISYAQPVNDDKPVPAFAQEDQYIKIESGSFTILSGESFRLKCKAYPETILEDVTWSSNNDDIIVVDSTGMVSARKAGIAAITVMADGVSDVVAVEVKDKMDDYGTLNLDYYADNALNEEFYDGSYYGHNGNSTTIPDIENQAGVIAGDTERVTVATEEVNISDENVVSGADGTEYINSSNVGNSNSANISSSNNDKEDSLVQKPSADQTNENSASNTELTNSQTSGNSSASETDLTTTYQKEIVDTLLSAGLTQYLSDAYMYEKDNTYCGEVLVEKDAMHIYIKKEEQSFADAVKPAIEVLIPGKSTYVWDKYTSMSSNKTIWVSGKKITYIMAEENAHAHIIIYYGNEG